MVGSLGQGGGYLLTLLSVQAVLLLIAAPYGEFPLNDDWAYAHSVVWLLEEHRFALSDWIAMNLLPQTLMGTAAASVAGFSFTVLRGVTQIVALATSLVSFRFFTACGLNHLHAFLATLAVVCLPWWQVLANTYMTDIYGMFFALLAATFLVKQLNSPSRTNLGLAILFSVIGMLQRQVVVVLPFAFSLAWLVSRGARAWRDWFVALVPVFATLLAENAYQWFLANGPGVPLAQQAIHGRLWRMSLGLIRLEPERWAWFGKNLFEMAGYLGLFLAVPLSVPTWQAASTRMKLLLGVVAAVLAAVSVWIGWLPPYRENNVLDAAGIGPFALADGMLPSAPIEREKGPFWLSAAVCAAIGVVLLTFAAARMRGAMKAVDRAGSGILVFLPVSIAAYVVPFAVTDYFDRYLLFVFPFVLAWVFLMVRTADAPARGRLLAAAAATVFVGLLGALAVHDYFAWNRARWEAARFAEQNLAGAPVNIDGGFEYNGYYNYEGRKNQGSAAGKRWWWVVDDRFVVAFEGARGYREVRAFAVDGYLPTTPTQVRLLARDALLSCQPCN